MKATVLAEGSVYFIFSLGSLCSSDVCRCESGRCCTLSFFLIFIIIIIIIIIIINVEMCHEVLMLTLLYRLLALKCFWSCLVQELSRNPVMTMNVPWSLNVDVTLQAPRSEVVLVVSRSRGVQEPSNDDECAITPHIPRTSRPPRIPEQPTEVIQVPSGADRGPPVTVTLIKDGAGLGFSLEGGKESPLGDMPLTIKKIFTGKALASLIKLHGCQPRWSQGNVLALRSKVHRFKPDWGRWIFSGCKNPEHKSSWRDFKLGSRVWDFRFIKEPQAWKNRPLSKI